MKKETFYNKKELISKLFSEKDVVLDVDFWGQGRKIEDENWPHRLIKNKVEEIYGIDLECDFSKIPKEDHDKYFIASADDFNLSKKFSAIFAGDLIEHLVNPGLFLDCSKKHLEENGRLIITTPNAFNLYVLAGKIMNREPVVNSDHTCYFNIKTLNVLLEKSGWEVEKFGFMYTLDYKFKESLKKKFLNVIYKFLSIFTDKYYETLVIVSKPKN